MLTATTWFVGRSVGDSVWGVLGGGAAGVTVYAVLLTTWVRRTLARLRSSTQLPDEGGPTGLDAEVGQTDPTGSAAPARTVGADPGPLR